MENSTKNWYDKTYKIFLVIPVVFLIICLVYLYQFNAENGDIIRKDVSLTGGTTISVFDDKIDIQTMTQELEKSFEDIQIRGISDIGEGNQIGVIIETGADVDEIKTAVEDYLDYDLTTENSSIEFTGSALSQGFYNQLKWSIAFAFLLMAITVFIIFRKPIPALAVILSAFADIVMTLAVVNFIGMSLSMAGVIAFLMLIGYSVDTDILLTSKVLKSQRGDINKQMFNALKTGMTMALTSIAAVAVALLIIFNFSDTLKQIFSVLLIGLFFDMFNTWFTNASLLKLFYGEKKI